MYIHCTFVEGGRYNPQLKHNASTSNKLKVGKGKQYSA